MRILLIGGSGFIGSHVARTLTAQGHDVVVFHRGTTRLRNQIVGDRRRLGDYADALRRLAPDVVVDLILSSGRQASELMQQLRGVTGRVVALSSADVYRACGVLHGFEPGPLEPVPLTERSALRTKLQTYPPDRIKMLQRVFGWLDEEYDKIPVEREILGDAALPGTVLRLPMVYGPGDPLRRFLSVIKRIDDQRPAILFEEGYARWRSPRGYVENVAAAIALAATSDRAAGRVYNVGDAGSLTELEWAELIAAAAGWTGRFVTLPVDRMPPNLVLPGNTEQHWTIDTTRIREELGYREPVAQADAIRRTIDWERANPSDSSAHVFDYDAEDAALRQHERSR
ncbi:MAG TPA: NAD-dependent epimerase/dehydratase family protein [Vicinamibacterales bacterium]|jgi:nucleoside-diphosphate-sugar epimerase|nr:NAD-dependent epimerase/dehydratase family protein [Vicinamibacterales bacterium]